MDMIYSFMQIQNHIAFIIAQVILKDIRQHLLISVKMNPLIMISLYQMDIDILMNITMKRLNIIRVKY